MSFACRPEVATLASLVVARVRSRTKTSGFPFASPGTRLLDQEVNATKRPSAEIAGDPLSPPPCTHGVPKLARVVVPAPRSRTNTSSAPFVSPVTRFVAKLSKTTKRPSAERNGS